MNYQNSMEAYYAYAKENREIDKKKEKSKWLRIWFVLSVFMLLLIWLYLSSLTPVETVKMDDSKRLLEEASIAKTKSTPSTTKEVLLVEKNPIKSLPTVTGSIPAFVKKEEVDTKSELLEKTTKEVLLVEKSPIEPLSSSSKLTLSSLTKEKSVESNLSITKKTLLVEKSLIEPLPTVTGSIPAFVKKEKVDTKSELLEKTTKVVVKEVKEELPVDLYHIYIVRKGESIYDIAAKQYGDTGMYLKIVNANKDLVNPNNIHEGEELFLPIVDESKSYSEILNFR